MSSILPEKIYGIIGFPLGHSLSPVLHNWAFRTHDLPGAYFKWELQEKSLERFCDACRVLPISGLSVTIPHKERIIPFLDTLTADATKSKAVNTVYWDGEVLTGDNTDIYGFCHSLKSQSQTYDSALVLGAGGAARAVVTGLKEMGVSTIFITVRNDKTSYAMAEKLDCTPLPWKKRAATDAELIVNTTPLGMKGTNETMNPWSDTPFHATTKGVYDCVYNPTETPFIKQARTMGLQCFTGIDMFVHQASRQFYRWTGKVFEEDSAKELVINSLKN